ncbi:MAG: 6-bladed beta-propeller [Balneolaceae bacterium]|nr:6-bladed beta-propeller [Balneolaceae bacterium]
MQNTRRLTLLLLSIVFVSCGTPDRDELPEDVRNLENLTVLSTDDIPPLELQPEATFGSTDTVIIGQLGDVVADDRGRVYLTDRSQKYIHVFASDGSYLARLGGEGRGPGEFMFPGNAAVISDRLFMQDVMLSRMNVYDLNAMENARSFVLNPKNTGQYPELEGYSARQFLVANDSTMVVRFSRGGAVPTAEEPADVLFYRMDPDGQIEGEQILRLPDMQYLTTTIDGQFRASFFSFNPNSLIALSGESTIYTADNREFLIRVYDLNGTYRKAIYAPYEAPLLDQDDLVEEYDNEMHKKMIRESALPERWPVLRSMRVDEENRLWISLLNANSDSSEWWVISDSGEILGRFTLPAEESLQAIRDGNIYVRSSRKNEADIVIRYGVL